MRVTAKLAEGLMAPRDCPAESGVSVRLRALAKRGFGERDVCRSLFAGAVLLTHWTLAHEWLFTRLPLHEIDFK